MPILTTLGAACAKAWGFTSGLITDQYFNLVSLLLPGNGTNGAQNNTFLDGSSNNFTITRNGNTTQGTFSPFSQTGWGNYFDGSGDFLSTSASAISSVGANNFSYECFVYCTRQTNTYAQGLISYGVSGDTAGTSYISFQLDLSGYLTVLYATSSLTLTDTALFPLNQWVHAVVCRSGSTLSLFVNGTRKATTSTSATVGSTGNVLNIGSQWYANDPLRQLQGYISNARILNGTSAYDATQTTITVPTAPLTAISGTSLLTCQSNRFKDNSTNNFTLTVNGNTSVVPFSPFNPTSSWSAATYGGSGYFDGNGDYLSIADNTNLRFGTNAFTIQAWVYRNASGAVHSIIAKGGASTGYVLQVTSTNVLRFTHGTTNVDTTTTIPASAWTHVAAVRTNTSTNGFQLYINGVSSATATVATDFNQTDTLYIGSDRSAANVMNGYISGLKYTNGTAESISVPTEPPTATTNVALLTNFTNAGIYDATSKNDLETVGNAQISTTQSKWGGGSMYFDGTGDYLMAPQNQQLELGGGDFTIECWTNISAAAANGGIVSKGPVNNTTNTTWSLEFNGSAGTVIFYVFNAGGNLFTSTSNLKNSTWTHIAISRSGNNTRMFINGTQEGATYTSAYTFAQGDNVYIGGGFYAPTTRTITGYIDDLRITKGYGRYTANFTPPTAAFPTL